MKVSCILPSSGRPAFFQSAIASFLAQDYPDLELVIFDTTEEGSRLRLVPADPRIRYYWHGRAGELTIGDLRNEACHLARGELICHFDDDDASAPTRVSHQVGLWEAHGFPDLVGYHDMLFYDQRTGRERLWKYVSSRAGQYVLGSSMLYKRSFWQGHPFQALNRAEDNHFFDDDEDPRPPRLLTDPGVRQMVARIHDGNSSPKPLVGESWQQLDDAALAAWARTLLGL